MLILRRWEATLAVYSDCLHLFFLILSFIGQLKRYFTLERGARKLFCLSFLIGEEVREPPALSFTWWPTNGRNHGLFHVGILFCASYATKVIIPECQYQFNKLPTRDGLRS